MEFFLWPFFFKNHFYIGTYNVRDQLQEVSTDGWFLTLIRLKMDLVMVIAPENSLFSSFLEIFKLTACFVQF